MTVYYDCTYLQNNNNLDELREPVSEQCSISVIALGDNHILYHIQYNTILFKLLYILIVSSCCFSLVAKYAFFGQPCKNTPKRGFC